MLEKKERPILFSGPMVRAILSGQKTVTRRVVKGGQVPAIDPSATAAGMRWSAIGQRHPRYGYCVFGSTEEECARELGLLGVCPYGKPGDRLWVRESTEAHDSPCGAVTLARYSADKAPVLITDCADPAFKGSVAHWDYPRATRPSIHMKREQARILLEITAVRVERLQDISEEQAISEGVHFDKRRWFPTDEGGPAFTWPQDAFLHLFHSVTGGDESQPNPWVWVVEFKRVAP